MSGDTQELFEVERIWSDRHTVLLSRGPQYCPGCGCVVCSLNSEAVMSGKWSWLPPAMDIPKRLCSRRALSSKLFTVLGAGLYLVTSPVRPQGSRSTLFLRFTLRSVFHARYQVIFSSGQMGLEVRQGHNKN